MAENKQDKKSGEAYRESDFILLDDLVYAPLHALAVSDQQLRTQVVEAVRNMGTLRQDGQEESIYLNTLNIAYDQIRQEDEDGYRVENLQMQVPLLSIVPPASLNVEKAEIDFSTEVHTETGTKGDCRIMARICSPRQRESDSLPRVTYRMKVCSVPATEGIMRLIDMLSANQIAKRLDSTPVAVDGDLGSDVQKNIWQEISELKAKTARLRRLYQKIADMLDEQERLRQIMPEDFQEDAYESDREKYQAAQSDIANRIMEYEESIINREIEFGLHKDYE